MVLIRSLKMLLLLGLAGLVYGIGVSLSNNARLSSDSRPGSFNGQGETLLVQHGLNVDILRTSRGMPTLRMQAGESRTYTDGHLELSGVVFSLHGAREVETLIEAPSAVSLETVGGEGRRAATTSLKDSVGSWLLQGGVTVKGTDGLTLQTPTLAYFEADGEARTNDRVDFRRGPASGTATGLTYEVGREVLRFRKDVTTSVEAGSMGLVKVEAGAATYFSGPRSLEMQDYRASTSRGETLTGSRLVVLFRESGGMRRLEGDRGFVLESSQPVTSGEESTSPLSSLLALEGVRTMQGERLAVLLDENSEPTSIEVSGNAQLTVQGVTGTDEPTSIDAQTLSFNLTDGNLTRAWAVGNVDLQGAPAEGETTGLHLLGDNLEADFDPNFGSVLRVEGEGQIQLSDEGMESHGSRTSLDPNTDIWTLTGEGETPATTTWLDRTIEAQLIELDRRNETLTARGRVRTSYIPPPTRTEDSPGALPFFTHSESIYAMAEALTFSEQGTVATYRERVRIWQGDSRLEASTVDLDERVGTLEASGDVISTFRQVPTGGSPIGANPSDQILNVAAETMSYVRSEDRIIYKGHVLVTQGPTRLSADTVSVIMEAGGGSAEKIEAEGNIELRDQERVGSGDQLVVDLIEDTMKLSGRGREATVQDLSSQQVVRGSSVTMDR